MNLFVYFGESPFSQIFLCFVTWLAGKLVSQRLGELLKLLVGELHSDIVSQLVGVICQYIIYRIYSI